MKIADKGLIRPIFVQLLSGGVVYILIIVYLLAVSHNNPFGLKLTASFCLYACLISLGLNPHLFVIHLTLGVLRLDIQFIIASAT